MIKGPAIHPFHAGMLALVMLTGSCSASGEEARLEFRVSHVELLSSAAPPLHLPTDSIAAEGGNGQIEVSGTIRLPDHCDALQAELVDRRPVLELRLRHTPSEGHRGPCDESDRSILVAYDAEVANLPPALYRLRIIELEHIDHGWRWWWRDSEPSQTLLHEEDMRVR